MQGTTYPETFRLYQQGLSPEEIAAKRELSPVTIFSHLAYLYEKGERVDIGNYVNQETLRQVSGVLQNLEEPYQLKEIFEKLEG